MKKFSYGIFLGVNLNFANNMLVYWKSLKVSFFPFLLNDRFLLYLEEGQGLTLTRFSKHVSFFPSLMKFCRFNLPSPNAKVLIASIHIPIIFSNTTDRICDSLCKTIQWNPFVLCIKSSISLLAIISFFNSAIQSIVYILDYDICLFISSCLSLS